MLKFAILILSTLVLNGCGHWEPKNAPWEGDAKKSAEAKPTPPPSAAHSEPLSAAVPSEVVALNMAVEKTIAAHQPQLRACYDISLKRNKAAKGKIVADYKIGPDNKVKDLKWTHYDRALEPSRACFTKELSSWVLEGLQQSAGKELSIQNQALTFGLE